MNIKIRPATEADLPAIHALVYELAVYEKEPEAVETTPAEYLEDFRNGLFESIVAEIDGQVAGMVAVISVRISIPAWAWVKMAACTLEAITVTSPFFVYVNGVFTSFKLAA